MHVDMKRLGLSLSKGLISGMYRGDMPISFKSSQKIWKLAETRGIEMTNHVQPVTPTIAQEEEPVAPVEPEETEEEVLARISETFTLLEIFTEDVIYRDTNSIIISGPPGVGKSYPTMEALRVSEKEYKVVTGSGSAPGLYRALFEMSNGGILLIDDCDAMYADLDCLNLLKGALDSTETRWVSWQKQSKWLEEGGIPRTFEFNGKVIFITNRDFDHMVERDTKISEHIKALRSRLFYFSMGIQSRRDTLLRVKDKS